MACSYILEYMYFTIYKQGDRIGKYTNTNKIQTRYKQDTNKIQTRYKQDTNKIQTRYKQDTNQIQLKVVEHDGMEQNKTGEQKGNRHVTDSSQLSEALSSLSDGQREPRPTA